MIIAGRPVPSPLAPDVSLPIAVGDQRLDTPAVLVDLDVVEANVCRMASYAARAGLSLRPHVKTHKSGAMAMRQLQAGSSGLCVATTSEASVMVDSGATDVLIAYPLVGRRKLERAGSLLDRAAITLVTDSADVTAGYQELAKQTGRRIAVLVEVDTGMNRVGVPPQGVVAMATEVARSHGLDFRGVMTHAGHAHDEPGPLNVERVARSEASIMGAVREELEKAGLPVPVVSAGSTLTAPYLRAADGVTEIRPGTYIYNDLRTLGCHACTPESLAAVALATVVSVNCDRVTVDAGSKTLTTTFDTTYGYGHLRYQPDTSFTKLSEEHGVLKVQDSEFRPQVGDRVEVLPVHVCAWMDLQPEVYGVRRGQVTERITVDAMRHSL